MNEIDDIKKGVKKCPSLYLISWKRDILLIISAI